MARKVKKPSENLKSAVNVAGMRSSASPNEVTSAADASSSRNVATQAGRSDSKEARLLDLWLKVVSVLLVIGVLYYLGVGRRYGAHRQFLASTYLGLGHVVTCLMFKAGGAQSFSAREYFVYTTLLSLGALTFIY